MDPARFRALRELVDQALELDTQARPAFLDGIDDQELRGDLAVLLLKQAQPGVLDRPAAEMLAPEAKDHPDRWAQRQIGRRIGPYALERLLGAGGMGTVYAAVRVDGRFVQTVAVKLVLAAQPGVEQRFRREQQILAGLSHPNIAQLLDGGETEDGIPYLIMEYVEGRSIDEHLGPLPAAPERVLELLEPIAAALAHAHRARVIHRDIKPNNILCTPEGQVKLLDFGIAKLAGEEDAASLTGQRLGPMTPAYAAPEQFQAGAITAATDIYQFGVLAFQLLSGRLPYQPSTTDPLGWARAVAEQPPASLPRTLPGSQDLDFIVQRCLDKRPDRRYPSMDALRDDLAMVRAGHPLRSRPGRVLRAFRRLAARPVAALAALALVAAAVVGVAWVQRQPVVVQAALPSADAAIFDPAFGFRVADLQAASPHTAKVLEQAYAADNTGNRARGIAHLETAHDGDATSPVPALVLAVWIADNGEMEKARSWLERARARVDARSTPWVRTYVRLAQAMVARDSGKAVQEAGALLDLRPEAWIFRAGRARALIRRGEREAALAELQRIEVRDLRLRRSEEVLADRASLGDLAGADAAFRRLPVEPDSPAWHGLDGRLAYTAGDDERARAAFQRAAELGLRQERFDWSVRGRLLSGILAANQGERVEAMAEISEARLRYRDSGEQTMVLDTSLVLAGLMDDSDGAARSAVLDDARALLSDEAPDAARQLATLVLLRLDPAREPVLQPSEALELRGGAALIEARRALNRGELGAARAAYGRAVTTGVLQSFASEEARLVALALGEPVPPARRIDPPIWPFARFTARWAKGAPAGTGPD